MVLATVACVQTSPISFAACGKGNAVCNKGNRRRLHTGNSNLNLKQFLSKNYIGLEHILSMKKSTIS